MVGLRVRHRRSRPAPRALTRPVSLSPADLSAIQAEQGPVHMHVGGVALLVGILSYDGGVYFGLLADRGALPDVAAAARALEAGVTRLAETARSA